MSARLPGMTRRATAGRQGRVGAARGRVSKSVGSWTAKGPSRDRKGPLACNFVAGAGFEPPTSGL